METRGVKSPGPDSHHLMAYTSGPMEQIYIIQV